MIKHSIRTLAALGLLAGVAGPAQLHAEDDADMRVWKESVDERLKALHNDVADFNKVRFDAFANMRYDDTRRPSANTGESGFYTRRAEFKFTGLIKPGVVYSLGFDLPDAKLKDVGLEISGLPLVPFMDGSPEWTLRAGQFRIPFGIMPQTSSSGTFLPERPIIFGGANNFGITRIVGERVMGAQGRLKQKLGGLVSLDAQAGGFNNATQDATRNNTSIAGQYNLQPADNDLSWVFRGAFSWDFIKAFLPEKSSLSTGASFIRDSKNTVWMANTSATQLSDEVQGAELKLALGTQILVQSEFARILAFQNGGLSSQREGWYANLIVNVLPWIASDIAKGDKLEVILNLEDHTTFPLAGANRLSRVGGGVKWSYWGGKNHTSVNYLVDGPDQNFGVSPAGAPTTRFIIQQQFAFDNGKARFMEKEGD